MSNAVGDSSEVKAIVLDATVAEAVDAVCDQRTAVPAIAISPDGSDPARAQLLGAGIPYVSCSNRGEARRRLRRFGRAVRYGGVLAELRMQLEREMQLTVLQARLVQHLLYGGATTELDLVFDVSASMIRKRALSIRRRSGVPRITRIFEPLARVAARRFHVPLDDVIHDTLSRSGLDSLSRGIGVAFLDGVSRKELADHCGVTERKMRLIVGRLVRSLDIGSMGDLWEEVLYGLIEARPSAASGLDGILHGETS